MEGFNKAKHFWMICLWGDKVVLLVSNKKLDGNRFAERVKEGINSQADLPAYFPLYKDQVGKSRDQRKGTGLGF